MGFIYMLTNNLNGKVYIGKTEKTVEERWKQHKRDSKRDYYKYRSIYQALNKSGEENFSVQELDESDDPYMLAELEMYYIEKYNSFRKGYNDTLGGFGTAWVDEKTILDSYRKNRNIEAVFRETGITQKTIRRILKKHHVNIASINEVMTAKTGTKLHMCDKFSGEIVQSFNSISEAYRFLSENNLTKTKESGIRHHIKACLDGKRKTVCGYAWVSGVS